MESNQRKGCFKVIRILLCGANGKMGHVIASCVAERDNMKIVAGIDLNTEKYSDFPIFSDFYSCDQEADVIIDFSNPALLESLLAYAAQTGTPLVAATTGYTPEQTEAIKAAAKQTAVFFTFNMSLGVNLLTALSQQAAKVLGDQFDIEIIEKHHNQKVDAPSGTAIMLAEAINKACDDRYIFEYDRHSRRMKRPKNEIGMHSIRAGSIVGEHEVLFAGRDEQLSLKHTITSKEVFAVGAVNAAAFLSGKTAGLYDMADLLAGQKGSNE